MMDKTTALMKRCQVGDSRWPDKANNLLAECYARLGALQEQKAALVNAVQLAVDLTESDVIRVRPSEREELMRALTVWNATLARTESAEGESCTQ